MKKLLLTLFLCLFPALLLADSLAPPATDLSMAYLSTIFGVVDGVLHGTGSEILGTMFGAFNATVLVMASVVLSYVLFISILNTAHEGEFLGKKWSSIWVPIRTVMGVGLLLPKATGYSFVQILVMWVVVQGVGAADQVWNVALDYMNRDGTIVEPIQSIHGNAKDKTADNSFLVGKAGSVLKSEVCMLTVYNALVNQNRASNSGVQVPDFLSSLAVTGKNASGKNTGVPMNYTKDIGGFITFPGKLPGTFANLEGMCGSISWDYINKDNDKVYNPAQLTANDSASIAARQFTLDLEPLAQSIANKLAPPLQANATSVPQITLKTDDPIFKVNNLVDSADDYFTIVKPALRSLQDGALAKYKEFIKDAKAYGWILAGSYYYKMANLNQQLRKTDLSSLNQKIFPTFNPSYETGPFKIINDDNVIANLKNNLPLTNGVIDNYINAETARTKDNNNPGDPGNPSLPANVASVNAIGSVVSAILNGIFPRVHDFESKLSDGINKDKKDPIFALVTVGNGLVSMVEQVWISILAVITGLGLVGIAAGFASGFWTVGVAVNGMLAICNLLIVIMPLITLWMGANFLLGSVLSYYVPLIPFFLFIFGGITWFAVVLEAVLAAPLVALGITHPEGHDFMGKAEQAIMLLSSVFLRPVLMVFGFIFGIILSFVALSLFNKGFSIAVQFLTEYNGDIFAIVYQTAMMAIYTAAVLAIINRSFAMIYEVPNKVLRWIGGPQESGHEESMLQGIRGQHDKDVGSITQQMPSGQTISESAGGGMALGRRMRELKQTNAEASGSGAGGGAGAAGGAPPPPVA
ncbi:MAG: type IVB secretion system protein DotA [Rickettsiella sp.]|nr:type IVB secretion system protein DotA [Rickettsiella sp.]